MLSILQTPFHLGLGEFLSRALTALNLEPSFSLSISARVAQRGVGKKSGPSKSAKRLFVGLKPPFQIVSGVRHRLLEMSK
jgi:hypothetical protein